jgi:hypothetical protein
VSFGSAQKYKDSLLPEMFEEGSGYKGIKEKIAKRYEGVVIPIRNSY